MHHKVGMQPANKSIEEEEEEEDESHERIGNVAEIFSRGYLWVSLLIAPLVFR